LVAVVGSVIAASKVPYSPTSAGLPAAGCLTVTEKSLPRCARAGNG
jgi:hypothetical protein